MTVVACFVGGQHYKSIPKYDSLPPLVANLAIQSISINSAYTSRILVRIYSSPGGPLVALTNERPLFFDRD